jgi:amidase
MMGVDERDEATLAGRGATLGDLAEILNVDGLKGARIGIFHPQSLEGNPNVGRVLEEAIAAMKERGAVIVDPVKIAPNGDIGEHEYEVLLYEFKADLNRYLADLGPDARVRSLKEAIGFNERHRDRVMPYFGQEIFLEAEAKGPLKEAAYRKALETSRRLARKEGLDAALAKDKLDAIVAPSRRPAWLIDLVNGDSGGGGSSTLAAVSGYPAITLPAGYAFGLPIGISFMGAPWSEPTLLKLAYAFEQAVKVRKAPRFLATAEVASAS